MAIRVLSSREALVQSIRSPDPRIFCFHRVSLSFPHRTRDNGLPSVDESSAAPSLGDGMAGAGCDLGLEELGSPCRGLDMTGWRLTLD
jgi:hypothetical protein